MPVYEYHCENEACPEYKLIVAHIVDVAHRDDQVCQCGHDLTRHLSAPHFKFQGVPAKGGGMDRFTADQLGIPVKELPSGLRHNDKDRAP